MPRGDRTGPEGAGAKTGRAAGYCSGYDMPGFANPKFPGQGLRRGGGLGLGRGLGRGFGRGLGRGWGRGFSGAQNSAEPARNLETMKSEETALKERLKNLQNEMKEYNS